MLLLVARGSAALPAFAGMAINSWQGWFSDPLMTPTVCAEFPRKHRHQSHARPKGHRTKTGHPVEPSLSGRLIGNHLGTSEPRIDIETGMPRKKSVKLSAPNFCNEVDSINQFLATVSLGQSDEHISWLHNYAIIRLYKEFEALMLDALVGAVNNDTSTIAATTDVQFPKHLTDEVCEFLITGTGYFDFKGRSGLIKTLKSFVPSTHYLLASIKKPEYKDALERLTALRNFAAHESSSSKRAALEAIGGERTSSSGSWLKRKGRFRQISSQLKALATEIYSGAPY
jgi:hypothetical protein